MSISKLRSELPGPLVTEGYTLTDISPTMTEPLQMVVAVVRDAAGQLWEAKWTQEKGLPDVGTEDPFTVMVPFLKEEILPLERAIETATRGRGGMWSVG